jgi:hypothetical protein
MISGGGVTVKWFTEARSPCETDKRAADGNKRSSFFE